MQSVALRLVCERETEIESFTPQEYWSIDVDLVTPDGQVCVVCGACTCMQRVHAGVGIAGSVLKVQSPHLEDSWGNYSSLTSGRAGQVVGACEMQSGPLEAS